MRRTSVLYLSLALLFIAVVVPSNAQSEESANAVVDNAGSGETLPVVFYDVNRNLSLRCDLPNENSAPYVWKKNGTVVSSVAELHGRVRMEDGGKVLALEGRAHEDDFGNYSCAVGGNTQAWDVRGRQHTKLPANSNVVEGQKLKLQCKMIGKPYGRVTWLYSNSTDEEDESKGVDVREALGERVMLVRSEQGVEEGELQLTAAQRSDAGRYWCRPATLPATPPATPLPVAVTTLRVKDMYAALWPFLGICAEVFVLCAVILVYERRRTKPELDDSDADNHDGKKS